MPESVSVFVAGAGASEKADECVNEIVTWGLEVGCMVVVRDGYPLFVSGAEAQVKLCLPVRRCDGVVLAAESLELTSI